MTINQESANTTKRSYKDLEASGASFEQVDEVDQAMRLREDTVRAREDAVRAREYEVTERELATTQREEAASEPNSNSKEKENKLRTEGAVPQNATNAHLALIDQLNTKIQELEQAKTDLETKVTNLKDEKDGLETTVTTLEQENGTLKTKVTSLEQDITDLTAHVAEFAGANAAWKEQNEALENALHQCAADMEDYDALVKNLDDIYGLLNDDDLRALGIVPATLPTSLS